MQRIASESDTRNLKDLKDCMHRAAADMDIREQFCSIQAYL